MAERLSLPGFVNDPFAWVANVDPFMVESTSQFRSDGPNALTSASRQPVRRLSRLTPGFCGARSLRASVASLTSALTSMTHLGLYSVTLFCNLSIKVYSG